MMSIIIPAWNGAAWIGACLASLEPQLQAGDEIIVVDNGSTDGTAELVNRAFPRAQVLRQEHNQGFASGVNHGLAAARGDVLSLLNQDVILRDGCLKAICARLALSGPAIVGCKLLYPDGLTLQHAGGIIHYPRAESEHRGYGQPDDGRWDEAMRVDYVTGAVFAFPRQVFDRVGQFDEGFFPAYYEETDYCFRAREAGFAVWYEPRASAVHFESQSHDVASEAHHQAAQTGRLRFILKNYRRDQILNDFIPAELKYVRELPTALTFTRRILAQAYFYTLLSLPEMRSLMFAEQHESVRSGELISALETSLAELYVTALNTTLEPLVLAEMPWEVVAQSFVSHAPLVGRWIARFREAWNSVSTKWYVRHILQQQNHYNRVVAGRMIEHEQRMIEHEQRMLIQDREIIFLTRALNDALDRIAQLEREQANR
jgi:GT2 family glycosyltransferase